MSTAEKQKDIMQAKTVEKNGRSANILARYWVQKQTSKVGWHSLFLYNSEIWTLTKTLENKNDAFQCRLLRKVIHVKWPRTISNKTP